MFLKGVTLSPNVLHQSSRIGTFEIQLPVWNFQEVGHLVSFLIECNGVPVAHDCNPSYLGGWHQEDQDQGSKPAQAYRLRDPISKKPITKKGWWNGARYRPWVQIPVPPKKPKILNAVCWVLQPSTVHFVLLVNIFIFVSIVSSLVKFCSQYPHFP
jgi:hypothetical protein